MFHIHTHICTLTLARKSSSVIASAVPFSLPLVLPSPTNKHVMFQHHYHHHHHYYHIILLELLLYV